VTPRSQAPTATRIAALLAACWLLACAAPAWAAACPKTSLPAIESEVMCPICGVPLVNAGGPQAENEREFIRDRVDECKSKEEVKAALIAEYGDDVLALPGTSGFDLAAWVVPAAGILLAALAVAIGALRWRRSNDADRPAAAPEDAVPDGPSIDEDLRRYDL
jgi:cytochrome c-type biogenesis protein CcmH/NrfF